MATFVCTECGAAKEGRCKPKKCSCGGENTFVKSEAKK